MSPHRIDYSKDGASARITLDLDDATLDADLDPVSARYVTLKNVLVDKPGPVIKRGAMTKPIGNVLTAATFGGFGVYKGPRRGGVSRDVNLGVTTGEVFYYEIDGSSAGVAIGDALRSTTGFVLRPRSIRGAVMAEDQMVFAGNPVVGKYGGSIMAIHSTGTATMTTGSKNVTLSTSLDATQQTNIIGAYILNTQDSVATRFCYQVVGVTSATVIVIDRNYAGSRSTLASTFEINPVSFLYKNPGVAGQYTDLACEACTSLAWKRLVLLQTYETDANGTEVAMPSRLRWSGLLGAGPSDLEGTAPFYGMHGFHASGYLDFPTDYGDLVNGVEFGGSYAVVSKRRLSILSGAPSFDSAGTLDFAAVYPVHGASIRSICASPYGVFFYDRKDGAMLWDGSGAPRKLSSRRVLSLLRSYEPTEVGYYNDHVFFMSATGGLLYSVLADAWSEITGDVAVSYVQPGRDTGTDATSQYLAGVSSSRYVVNLANVIDSPGGAAADWGDTTILVDIKTGKIGDGQRLLRPTKMIVSYRATDLTTTNPSITATLTTGLPDTSDTAHTFTDSTTLVESTDVETKVIEITTIDRDPMAQLRLLQVNAAGKLDIYSVVIDCDVEGEGPSSV